MMNDVITKKFDFDTVFAANGDIIETGGAWRETVSKADVDKKTAAAFERGRQDEMIQAQRATGQAIAELATQITDLHLQLAEIANQTRMEATQLALVVARKIAGTALSHFELAHVSELIEQTLHDVKGAPRVKIAVSQSLATVLEDKLLGIAENTEFKGVLEITGEPDVTTGSVVFEWAEGAVSFHVEEIENRIEQEVSKWLAATRTPEPVSTQPEETQSEETQFEETQFEEKGETNV
ncbi:MAG: hypothetical protein JKX99_03255 [Robiginitomaculum sp.]|nr:hypothetical protein [Robiginitomaculum sp.]